jgi:hypothetical protein
MHLDADHRAPWCVDVITVNRNVTSAALLQIEHRLDVDSHRFDRRA